MFIVIAQIMPKILILSDANDDILLEKIYQEYGTFHMRPPNTYSLYKSLFTGASIEIKKVLQKDFSFEKGRYMLLNWYISHFQNLQSQNLFTSRDAIEETLSNQNIFFMDPEEGNKTHAYLQLEGLIHLDDSYLTVCFKK